MKITTLLLSLILFVTCDKGWSEQDRKKLINECIEAKKTKESDLQKLSELCSCSTEKFISKISWSDYQRNLKGELSKDEEAAFSNDSQIVLNKIMEECDPPELNK